MEPLREKESIVSVASTSCAPPGHLSLPDTLISPSPSEDPLLEHPQWIRNPKATRFLVGLLTSMYVLLLTIVSCLIALSSAWNSPDLWLAETVGIQIYFQIFSLLMYGIATLFFMYTYFVVIYPKPINTLILFLNRKTSFIPRPDRWLIPPALHNGEGAGTLYLRLGALLFGTLGSVLWGCEIYLCFAGECVHRLVVSKHIAAIIFTFLQMHFIVCNSKITFHRSNHLASFGMMHCVAVNIWTWFSMCLVKAQVKRLKKQKKEMEYHKNSTDSYSSSSSSSSSSSEEEDELESSTVLEGLVEAVVEKMKPMMSSYSSSTSSYPTYSYNSTSNHTLLRMQSMARLGDFSSFLLTCLVEYSLIGAAVCFIIWKYMGATSIEENVDKKKKKLRMDCTSTTVGLFAGIFFMTAAFVTIGIYTMLYNKKNAAGADLVIGIVNLVLFCVALVAVIFGSWRMRVLQYRLHAHGEVIDEILLIIGLVGELVYCSIGFDMIINGRRTGKNAPNLAIAVFTFRIVQVIIQAMYILIASRLRCLSTANTQYQPGKQTLTFLVIINISLFVYHAFEGMKSTYGFPSIMESKYFELLNISSPLVVFYRFHSSACLAEIWKHTYSTKHNHHHHHNVLSPISSPMSDNSHHNHV
ncbi:CRE-OTPL-7 protein [Caenorhabditis remanei]|uniref:CRE-OTPL-7 protein n=1 Tax=Caenorhabditis remanei TaxID=31234 RepID=E3LZV0_CAERE|nr:CRE-OTPL-7 protein [Caenorhabditis remanei]